MEASWATPPIRSLSCMAQIGTLPKTSSLRRTRELNSTSGADDALGHEIQEAMTTIAAMGRNWRSMRHAMARGSSRFCACSLLLLAASYAVFANNVAVHALVSPTSRLADVGAASSSSSTPAPSPVHDESKCPFCLSGSGRFAVAPSRVVPLPHVDSAHALRPDRTTAPRAPAASPEAARAPPHDLFS